MADITIRKIHNDDFEPVSQLLYDAFAAQSRRVGGASEGSLQNWRAEVTNRLPHIQGTLGLVAAKDNEIVGVVFMNYMDEIASAGPWATKINVQSSGIMRKLVNELVKHAEQLNITQMRLLQTLSNLVSFPLYIKCGFKPVDYIMFSGGYLTDNAINEFNRHNTNITVREVSDSIMETCNKLFVKCCGYSRINHIRINALDRTYNPHFSLVAIDNTTNKVVGYWSRPDLQGFLCATNHTVFQALYVDACKRLKQMNDTHGPTVLITHSNYESMLWLLNSGIRLHQQMTIMCRDITKHIEYQQPTMLYCSSVEM